MSLGRARDDAPALVWLAVAGDAAPADVSALLQGAHHDMGRLRFQEARDEARSAAEGARTPGDQAKAHALLGIACIDSGDAATGEQELAAALKLDPNLALAHAGSGILDWTRAQASSADSGEAKQLVHRAEEEFKEALQHDPDEPSAHDGLGCIDFLHGRSADAIKEFQTALKHDPEFVTSHFNLGNAYLQDQQWSQAEACYRKAIGLHYEKAEFHALLAAALLGQGKRVEAQQEAQEARRLGLEKHWIYDELARR